MDSDESRPLLSRHARQIEERRQGESQEECVHACALIRSIYISVQMWDTVVCGRRGTCSTFLSSVIVNRALLPASAFIHYLEQ